MCGGGGGPKGPSKKDKKKAREKEKKLQKKLREQQKKQEKKLKELQKKYEKENKQLQKELQSWSSGEMANSELFIPSGDLYSDPYGGTFEALLTAMMTPPESKPYMSQQSMPTGQYIEPPKPPEFIPPAGPSSGTNYTPAEPPPPPPPVTADMTVVSPNSDAENYYQASLGTNALTIPLDQQQQPIGTNGLNIPR